VATRPFGERQAPCRQTCDYDDVIADRRARLGPDAARQAKVFERAYDIDLQVIDLRERHGLTQQQLARRCGIDQADISRIERGSTSPTARTLQRIAEALDADVRLVSRASLRRTAARRIRRAPASGGPPAQRSARRRDRSAAVHKSQLCRS